jgi:hypothetical protein
MNEIPKKKDNRGKKAGVSDTVNIPIELLIQYQNTLKSIPVRRKWAELMAETFHIELLPPPEKKVIGFEDRAIANLDAEETQPPRVPIVELEEEEL